MRCRYCGETLHGANWRLISSLGEKCAGNPEGKHVGVTDGESCVYCGDAVKSVGGKLHTKLGTQCKPSPTGMHCLQ